MQTSSNHIFGDGTALSMNSVMRRVYLNMTLALIVTAITSMTVASTQWMADIVLSGSLTSCLLIFGLEIGLVIWLTRSVQTMKPWLATALFYLFAVVNGLAFTPILFVFTGASIAKVFFITAGVFGAMSVYGFFTTRDLSGLGTFFLMGVIGLLIAVIVNWFLKSETMELLISLAGVAIFTGLTAWDTQAIKRMAASGMPLHHVSILGALTLYLDFINLFIYLLRLLGRRN